MNSPEDSGDSQPSPSARRLSLPAFIANAASGIGGAIARTAGAAGTLLTDADLRKRGTQVITTGASKGLKGIQHGKKTELYPLIM